MQRDIRRTVLFREAESLHESLRQPGTGQISDAAEIHVSPDGRCAVFAGTMMERLEGAPPTRICQVDLISGATHVLTFGPNMDRMPRYSPDGTHIAFLSDRHRGGDFQLFLLNVGTGAARQVPSVEGWVEYLHWSPDGRRILLGVAGHGAEISGAQGALASKPVEGGHAAWMPAVATRDENYKWRSVWLYELTTDRVHRISQPGSNIWEAVWCGNDALAAVISCGPKEGQWYAAHLYILDVETGGCREIYTPRYQLGWPDASPSGEHLAIVEAICSDRWLVAGDLQLIDTASGSSDHINTRGVDITCVEWQSDTHLIVAGQRGFETVVGVCNAITKSFTEVWSSRDISTGGFCVTVSGINDAGDCALIGEGFVRAPEIAVIRGGDYRAVRSFDLGYTEQAKLIGAVESVNWAAPDGLEIEGWLLRPEGKGPHPLVMNVHGGPVSHWRPTWLGRKGVSMLMLLKRGYAIFMPNPRGSSGRGQDYARRVLGDMGGADTYDCISGLDHLIGRGIADRTRLGVTGGSYGGYMTAWLVTQDARFSAAVALAPVTNKISQHLICNIPEFVSIFLADHYTNANGKYFQRSPIMYAHNVKTPTLSICGALDRCTPPEEAMQFHNALLENGVESMLITYPQEGHGIRTFPAAIDYAARLVAWFEQHMGASHE